MADTQKKSAGASGKPSAPAPKKRKKKNSSTTGAVLFGILVFFGICLTIGLFIRSSLNENLNGLKEKTEELIPNGFTYPTEYEEYVIKYGKEFDVDPVLIFSVIKVESNFVPEAESNVGARGLMQLMNEAYDWVKFRLDDDSESFDDMYDPETNIMYGTYYLSFLMERYDGSVDLTAAAYHCGMGYVDKWLEDGTIDADDFRVEDIPEENDQTSHYVNKINTAYDAYKKLLAERSSSSIYEEQYAYEEEQEPYFEEQDPYEYEVYEQY